MLIPKKTILAIAITALISVTSVLAIEGLIVTPLPNTLKFHVNPSAFTLRGPTIVFRSGFSTFVGSSNEYAIVLDNGDGPQSITVSFGSNVTGWVENGGLTSFAYRLSVNGTYVSPANDCPHIACTVPFTIPKGGSLLDGFVEIGPLAQPVDFYLNATITR